MKPQSRGRRNALPRTGSLCLGAGRGVDPEIFTGNALNAVDAKGRLSVPAFIRSTLERTSDARIVSIGVHESRPCLTVFGQSHLEHMLREFDRRQLATEERGEDSDELDDRSAGVFGMIERVPYDGSGRIILPKLLRNEGRIDDLALFVSRARFVELWNPRVALAEGGERLKRIAAYYLEQRGAE